ncbi:sensor histidine kinase [Paenibacillus turpanensis]|uniref:sensor histidine kinase n=1 Tax=Paenibacillus turpanensis TaxID=2689078 RepID=UPI00140AA47A|nr:HAMP domain-containing sensor histidine kinase [Paenibacillus turpanensis]
MNVHRRFIIQFFMQMTLVFIILIVLITACFAIIGYSTMKDKITQDLSFSDAYYFEERMDIRGEEVVFDETLKETVLNQQGWLLLVTYDGVMVGSFNAPEALSSSITKSWLTSVLLGSRQPIEPIQYAHWEVQDDSDSQSYILLYGKTDPLTLLVQTVTREVDWERQKLRLSPASVQQLVEHQGWAQLLDSKGQVMDSIRADGQPTAYGLKDVLSLTGDGVKPSAAAYWDETTGQTVLVGTALSKLSLAQEAQLTQAVSQKMMMVLGLFILLLMGGTIWYARKFGLPLLSLMKWIQTLGNGVYDLPYDSHGRPVLTGRNGKLKRRYRLYKDLIATLTQLTETLRSNESDRFQAAKTREEWITGISHDLKTPLSSISGYAQMLESADYTWSVEETREFAATIAEKSKYMMELLEDLTLTYQLKNHALPHERESIELNEFIRRTVIQFVNDPANSEMRFVFQPHDGDAWASVDPKWFQRIMNNLIANAIKHNPLGTSITVSVASIETYLLSISVADDGKGMDQETQDKLFQRYYRGTNTGETESGSGLGMAITKQLVQLHGGSIQVKSAPNEGTAIRILLPVEPSLHRINENPHQSSE